MTHYRLADSTPSAIILARNPRTSSLDELKTYQGNEIFLNNGDEFQIRLFNPLTEKIGVQVSINGKTPNRLLVLNPGEVVDVDRFIDEQRRMIFETYQYDDGSQAARDAVAKNGIIQINFHKEFVPYNPNLYGTTITTANNWSGSSGDYATLHNVSGMGAKWSPIFEPQIGDQGNQGNQGVIGNAGTSGQAGCTSSAAFFHMNADITLNSNDATFTASSPYFNSPGIYAIESDLSFVTDEPEVKMRSTKSKLSKSLRETGRVEKGEKSDQKFKSVDIQFNTYAFHTVVYHLKPMSEKNSDIREIREYCTQCSYRVRNEKWMFCPKCGNKL